MFTFIRPFLDEFLEGRKIGIYYPKCRYCIISNPARLSEDYSTIQASERCYLEALLRLGER